MVCEAYCSCEETGARDNMVAALVVRKTMMAVLMVINIVMSLMDAVTRSGDDCDEDGHTDGG